MNSSEKLEFPLFVVNLLALGLVILASDNWSPDAAFGWIVVELWPDNNPTDFGEYVPEIHTTSET